MKVVWRVFEWAVRSVDASAGLTAASKALRKVEETVAWKADAMAVQLGPLLAAKWAAMRADC